MPPAHEDMRELERHRAGGTSTVPPSREDVRELDRLRSELAERARSVAVLKANLGKLGRQEEQRRTELTQAQKKERELRDRVTELEWQLAEQAGLAERARLDAARLTAEKEQREAELKEARAEAEQVQAQLEQREAELKQALRGADQAREAADHIRRELPEPKVESTPPRDEASTDPPPEVDALKAIVEALTQKVTDLERTLGQRQAVIIELRARGAERDHLIEELRRELSEARQSKTAEPEVEVDRLSRIRGIGLGYERILNAFGITRIAQVAAWTQADLKTVSSKLKVSRSRVSKWVENAKELLATED